MCSISMADDDYLDVTAQLLMARKVMQPPDLATAPTSNLQHILCTGETNLANSLPSKIIA